MGFNNTDEKIKVVDELFEMVHEIKNSMAVCRGYLDIIDFSEVIDMKKYLSVIRSEIDRSTDMISNFMLYKKNNVIKENININVLLNDLCSEFEDFIRSKNILFKYNIFNEVNIYIKGDYNKLQQVFINLINNSIESINGKKGVIKVRGYLCKKYYNIFIEDNGCGMSDEVLQMIRLGGFTTKKGGNGIGVTFSKKIIKEHDGEIEYISREKYGTRVIVKLPIVVL